MKEKSQGYAEINDVDLATFTRFLEWMYYGNYTALGPEDDSPFGDNAPAEENLDLSENFGGSGWLSSKKKKKGSRWGSSTWDQFGVEPGNSYEEPDDLASSTSKSRNTLRQAFINRSYTGLQSTLPTVPKTSKTETKEKGSYEEVLLCHAQLYRFAEEKDIQQLKTLALGNLHDTLKRFTLNEERTGDIISLLRYAYQNTQVPGSTETEPLRALLKDYMGFEMDTLMKDENFGALMIEDGGPLLSDFMEMVKRRI